MFVGCPDDRRYSIFAFAATVEAGVVVGAVVEVVTRHSDAGVGRVAPVGGRKMVVGMRNCCLALGRSFEREGRVAVDRNFGRERRVPGVVPTGNFYLCRYHREVVEIPPTQIGRARRPSDFAELWGFSSTGNPQRNVPD